MQTDLFVGDESEAHDVRWPIIASKRMVIGPESARSAYDSYQFSRQRRISKDHVAKYAAAMHAGTFKPYSTVTLAQSENGLWIVDGNHTLLAVEAYAKPFPLTIEYRAVNDEEDAAILYSTFEARKRSLSDHMQAAGLKEITGVSPSMLARFTPGIHMLELGIPERLPRLVDVAFRQQIIERWKDQCSTVRDIISGVATSKILMARTACIAMMFLTVRHQPERAVQFWRAIAENNCLIKGTPQHTAWTLLSQPVGTQLPPEQFKRLSLCWNAWFSGTDEYKLAKVHSGIIFVTVAGTDWINKRTGGFKA